MRFPAFLAFVAAPSIALAGCGISTGATTPAPSPPAGPAATPLNQVALQLKDAAGTTVAEATLTPKDKGVVIHVEALHIAPAGMHGVHIHAVGRCDAPDFLSAGGHFNPGGNHSGDLPGLPVGSDLKGEADYFVDGATLFAGDPNSMRGTPTGASLVIHADGGAGPRIACAVIGPEVAPPPTPVPPPDLNAGA
jgi:Cu-Zn family superoxide dismutase